MKLRRLIAPRRFWFLAGHRRRQFIMRASLVGALVITIGALASTWRQVEFSTIFGNPELSFYVADGMFYLTVEHLAYVPLEWPEYHDLDWFGPSTFRYWPLRPQWSGEWRPGIVWWFELYLPFWIPLLIVLLLGLLISYTSGPKPWQCRKCRYDLRGLEGEGDGGGDGAVCPECGLAKGEG